MSTVRRKSRIAIARRSTVVSDDYWMSARQPLPCLVFLIPLLVSYEAGVLLLTNGNADGLRNGADYWMRGWLASIGLTQALLLPCLVVCVLLAWQVIGRYAWNVSGSTIAGMLAESLLFAVFLLAIGQLHDMVFARLEPLATASIMTSAAANRVVAFIGAGVYEEVMFRLCLLPIGYAVFRFFDCPKKWSAGLAIFCTSLIFAFAHYVGPAADQFSLFSFTFRAMAGSFFACLFFVRGFGITVGSHAAYDLLVGVLLAHH